jgi:hypothetical protein
MKSDEERCHIESDEKRDEREQIMTSNFFPELAFFFFELFGFFEIFFLGFFLSFLTTFFFVFFLGVFALLEGRSGVPDQSMAVFLDGIAI